MRPRDLALANPLPLVPRAPPRPAFPSRPTALLPLLASEPSRERVAGVAVAEGFEEIGGFSMKEVSVVLDLYIS